MKKKLKISITFNVKGEHYDIERVLTEIYDVLKEQGIIHYENYELGMENIKSIYYKN